MFTKSITFFQIVLSIIMIAQYAQLHAQRPVATSTKVITRLRDCGVNREYLSTREEFEEIMADL